MNSKKKKIVGVIVALVIVAVGIAALWYVGPNLYETEEPSTEVSVQEDKFLYEKMMANGSTEMDQNIYTLDQTEGEYIWVDISEEDWVWSVYSVSKESLENKISEYENPERGMRVTDMDVVKKDAEMIVSNFASEKQKLGLSNYVTYHASIEASCFNDMLLEGPSGEAYNLSTRLNKEGLVLSHNNVVAHRVMAKNDSVSKSDNRFVVEVSSNVTCVENSGSFEDIDWIPEKGDSAEVTFVVELSVVDGGKHEIYVINVGVIG